MTSKLTFRARNLDAFRPMAIYNSEDLPELAELNAINRSVPAMPTGMEKEEEAEKHLQDILELQNQGTAKKINLSDLYIPTPEVFSVDTANHYTVLYAGEYKVPRQYIHVQPFSVDSEKPDYDMDSEDEAFMETSLKKSRGFDVTPLIFEDMIDRLEKSSGRAVVSSKEAKLLLKGDDELILAVYDYWIDKRLKIKQPLIPTVKSDKRDLGIVAPNSSGPSGSANNSNASSTNPYIAFRRRTEKMQTRKNRKNDETSYEKMLKLRRDLSRAVVLLEMIKRREKMKKENLTLTSEIFEKRYQSGDFEGKIFAEVQVQKSAQRMVLQPNQYFANKCAESWVSKHHSSLGTTQTASEKNRRENKRKHGHHSRTTTTANLNKTTGTLAQRSYYPISTNGPEFGTSYLSDEERISQESSISEPEEDEMEGQFAFRRRANVQYLAPVSQLPFGGSFTDEDGPLEGGGWPWDPPSEGGAGDPRYRYSLASLSTPKPRCIGFARRRVGRGGRYVIDRAFTDYDDVFKSFNFTILDSKQKEERGGETSQNTEQLELDDWPHYRPLTPPHVKDDWDTEIYKLPLTADANSISLPTQPVKPICQPGMMRSVSYAPTQSGRSLGIRTVSVDSVTARNAATALVTSDMIDIFRTLK